MKSLAELEKLKVKNLNKIKMKNSSSKMRIVIGMATCGLAAGAKKVMDSFVDEVKKRNVKNVDIITTGCIGVCRLEPMVEITDKDGNRITYVNMTIDKVERVVVEHLVNGRVCLDYTIGIEEEKNKSK